jgi:hypothetical protein
MIKIFAELENQEVEITFAKNKKDWIAKDDKLNKLISIKESEGFIDEKSLYVASNITTSKIVIYERFLSAFNEYSEEVNAGFEALDETNTTQTILKPYDPDDIKVRRETFSVYEVNRMITEKNDIDLNPDFQRNLVWDNIRKSALIESILLGIPIPVFYFAESKTGQYHVVDGLQRLSTIKQFFNNDFALKKLEYLKDDCEGKYYNNDLKTKGRVLDRKHTRRLENAQLIVNVIEFTSPQKVKYDIFKRLNTGGKPLNKQEVRNCIASKEVRKFLRDSAHSIEFSEATSASISDNRMDAQELVLRFIGFRLEQQGLVSYTGDMNSFLDSVMDIINEFNEIRLESYKSDFINGLKINYHLFGEFCFRKCLTVHLKKGAKRPFINKALFLSWMMETYFLDYLVLKSKINFGEFSKIIAIELDKKEKYYTILTTGTSDKQNVRDASSLARNLLLTNNLL